MSLFDLPNDPEAPEFKKRKAYAPTDYQGLKGSSLLGALQGGANVESQRQQGTTMRLPGSAGMGDQGAEREFAQRQSMGAMQPWDERFKQQQHSSYLDQMDKQQAFEQAVYETQLRAAQAQQEAMGGILGMAGGYGLGAWKNKKKSLGGALNYDPAKPDAYMLPQAINR